jgi:hypothetical protein
MADLRDAAIIATNSFALFVRAFKIISFHVLAIRLLRSEIWNYFFVA